MLSDSVGWYFNWLSSVERDSQCSNVHSVQTVVSRYNTTSGSAPPPFPWSHYNIINTTLTPVKAIASIQLVIMHSIHYSSSERTSIIYSLTNEAPIPIGPPPFPWSHYNIINTTLTPVKAIASIQIVIMHSIHYSSSERTSIIYSLTNEALHSYRKSNFLCN